MNEIPVSELARRLCVESHPLYHSTGQRVPCGIHTGEASRLYGLTQRSGNVALGVILDARREAHLPAPRGYGSDLYDTLREALLDIGADHEDHTLAVQRTEADQDGPGTWVLICEDDERVLFDFEDLERRGVPAALVTA